MVTTRSSKVNTQVQGQDDEDNADVDGDVPVHLDENGQPKIIEIRFIVEPDFHGYRLDHYLKRKIRRLSRTRIQEVIRTQLEGPSGRRMKAHSPVQAGDKIVIRRPARAEPACPRIFGVLMEDPDFIVVDKPAGLPVHATARYYFHTLTRLLSEKYPGQGMQIAHRLDRETSGCLVVARGKEAASRIKSAFEKRHVEKTYLALVHGDPPWPDQAEITIDVPLALADETVSRLKIRMVPAVGRPDALSATTRVRVVERHGRYSLVACRPITGRQHQIRAHLAAMGHPIVGDKLYAHGDEAFARFCDREPAGVSTAEVEAEFGICRQALHAASIRFPHPRTGLPVYVESPLPSDLRKIVS
ncbi:MAG: RluA family pseudouridine synthase [Deltaproteobacteria bacterium]|nr:RluA family pseudouridine synthase [Deltaproteobacteria bacterium]